MIGTAESIEAEEWVLTSEAGASLLDAAEATRSPRPADLARWRTLANPAQVSAALRLIESRRKGAAKFTLADCMWLDPVGIEQATSEPVARHKAERFASAPGVVVDLCSGIGGDALALAAVTRGVIAVDLDPAMARRLRWNAGVYGVSDRLQPVRSRAQDIEVPANTWVHIDPDRRVGRSVRARQVGDYEPGLHFMERLIAGSPAGAIKLSPGSDFETHFGHRDVEIEVISLGGECKEATVWFGALAGCQRRATVLPSGVSWTNHDEPRAGRPTVAPIGSWVYDPDPALIRAGLLDGFAAASGLSRFADGIDYLTGTNPLATPFLQAFEVEAVLPLDLKRLKRELAARCVGRLEIKVRGVELTPEKLRKSLELKGDESAMLLLAGGQGPARAILSRRSV